MEKPPLWTFEGFVTPAGNRIVDDWFHDELGEDERDLIRDRIYYLKDVERHLWRRPGFDKLDGDLNEIRKDVPGGGTIRIYGYFPSGKRHSFVLLEGRYKDKKNDKAGKRIAEDRLKQIKQGMGSTHGFNFEERTLKKDSQGTQGTVTPSQLESIGGDCVPDQGDKR
jgi:hypothetical protein